MAITTQVLFGKRLYDQVTYSENTDPQTFNASLSDTQATSDTDVVNAQKPLADSQTLADAIAKLVERTLTDSQSSTDTKIASLLKPLLETQTSSDSYIITAQKVLADLISLSETWTTNGSKLLADSSSLLEAFTKAVYKTFSDSTTLLDLINIDNPRFFMDAIFLSDASSKVIEKVFNEITTHTPTLYSRGLFGVHLFSGNLVDPAILLKDMIVKQVQRAFFETLFITDNLVKIQQTKSFLDFLILQEWVGMKLKKAAIWTETSASAIAESIPSLYSRDLYQTHLYSTNSLVIWVNNPTSQTTWTNTTNFPATPSLYSKLLFGTNLYSTTPVINWTIPPQTNKDWVNFDEQNNQEA